MDYIKQCMTCIDNAKMPVETLHPHEVPAGPWIKVGMDFFQDDSGQKFLIVADYFSEVLVHLSCHIDSPPKDAEIPERSVFDRRSTICCDDRQWTTLQQQRIHSASQENLTSSTRHPHHISINQMDSLRPW